MPSERRNFRAALFAFGLVVVSATAAYAEDDVATPVAKKSVADPTTQVGPGSVEGFLANGRWRGTRIINVPGKFIAAGERVQFASSDGKLQFVTVENLLAERVAKMVAETSEPLTWIVQGTITEYKNGNYLILRHAVITGRTPNIAPPADTSAAK